MKKAWRFIPYCKYSAMENMAFDEAMYRFFTLHPTSLPTLRFYGWSRPSISLGRFGQISDVVDVNTCHTLGVDIVRRPTGGKVILHGFDFSYSIVASVLRAPFNHNLMATYEVIAHCLVDALSRLGINATLANTNTAKNSSSDALCFSSLIPNELTVEEKKICGNAQVRNRTCFLQHGSIALFANDSRYTELCERLFSSVAYQAMFNKATSIDAFIDMKVIGEEYLANIFRGAFEDTLSITSTEGSLSVEEMVIYNNLLQEKV